MENAKRFDSDRKHSEPSLQVLQLLDKLNNTTKKAEVGTAKDNNLSEIIISKKPEQSADRTIVT